MSVSVRFARSSDIDQIHAMGTSDRVFEVSPAIHFYEETELKEWVNAPHENVLLVAEESSQIIGFLYAKIMSHHWAMLDNFYVKPIFRQQGIGKQLLCCLTDILRQRGIVYVSTLCDSSDEVLLAQLPRQGFKRTKAYIWHEMFL